LLTAVIVHGGTHTHIDRESLPGVTLIDAANRCYVAIIPPVCNAHVLQSQRLA
jgi:cytosine/adenosine deaminase-related metal-dependent hydrolase